MATVRLDGLIKRFGDLTAVDGLDLQINQGEFLVVVGPSGCGKSTTLRMIAGLESPTEGRIQIDGQDVTDVEPKNRDLAMVFQNYALYPHMTAKQNMSFGIKSATNKKISDEQIEERLANAAKILDIEDLLDRKPAALSGGEQQRVALGRGIVREADIFLMDEPLSNLDAKLRLEMREELQHLHEQFGMTTIYVTHDQVEAMTLADRVAVMNDGELQQMDPPQKLYDYPNNQFVAEFIGEPPMNILPVHIEESTATIENLEFDLVGSPDLSGDYNLGIRPEDLNIKLSDGNLQGNSATVYLKEPLGNSLLVMCEVSSDISLTIQTEPRKDVEVDDTINITYDHERIHLFDSNGDLAYHSDKESPKKVMID